MRKHKFRCAPPRPSFQRVTAMSKRLRQNSGLLLFLMERLTPRQRTAVLKTLTPEQIKALGEIAVNAVYGTIFIAKQHKKKLRKHVKTLEYIGDNRNSLQKRKKTLVKRTSFLTKTRSCMRKHKFRCAPPRPSFQRVTAMSKRLRQNSGLLLFLMERLTPRQRTAVLKTLTPEQIKALGEIAVNAVYGTIFIAKQHKKKLRKHVKTLEYIGDNRNSLQKRKETLVNHPKAVRLLLAATRSQLKGLLSK